MHLSFDELSPGQIYHLMIQTIVPRPIAWVLSDNGDDSFNLAPFSYFNGICSAPPLCMISVGHKRDGSKKDTWRNIEERDDYVLHIGSTEHAEMISATSASLPHGDSEITANELSTTPLDGSRLPRLVGPRVAFACRKHRILELGDGPQGVIFGEITAAWIDDAVVLEAGDKPRLDPRKLDPLSRLGGNDYGVLGDVRSVERPG
jgi:flavin reductase (DIM6/NTAB) family NADH-FMN oxidoreductase RutF